jgi:two-component system sensor histidine kinase AlgZ
MSAFVRRALDLVREDLWPYLVFPALFTVARIAFVDRLGPGDSAHVFRDTFVAIACVGGPAHLTFHAIYGWMKRQPALRQMAVGAGVVALGVLLGTELAIAILAPLHDVEDFGADFGRRQFWLLAAIGVGFVSAVMFAASRFRDRIRDTELRELRARHDALAAQIEALQARIEPHFLFNSLNTVASLIEEDPRRAEAAVERLSDLLRHTLAASRSRLVPLRDELDAVTGFLELSALRHGERLRFRLHVEPGTEELLVPPLVLQPLVENAVLHGIVHRREGGQLDVRVTRAGERLALEVEDDGPGPAGSAHTRGSGTALRDLAERLRLLYDGAGALEHGQGAHGGYRVSVTIPALRVDPA